MVRELALPAITAAVLLGGAPPSFGEAIITYGQTALGVNNEGHLNVFGPGPDGEAGYGVWHIGTGDATYPGCLCEGWGVAVTREDGFRDAGWASVDNGGIGGITGGVFGSTAATATSTVNFTGSPVTVAHAFGPSLAADVFQAQVTITNTSATETLQDVVYRRAMDWDVPPTEFNEYVTHQGVEANLESNGGNVRYASDNGFANADPRTDASFINGDTVNTDFVHNGPTDHGSVFDFAFGDLAPGASRTFNIFYGSASTEAGALSAVTQLQPNLYSLGLSTFDSGSGESPNTGSATYLFAFGGVGGVEPGTSPDTPLLPFVPAPGQFEFVSPPPRRWFDPPFVDGFHYTLDCDPSTPDCHFTFVDVPPASFGFGAVELWIGGSLITTLPGGGGGFDFITAGYTTVMDFILKGISPLLDAADPGFSTAFPAFLDWAGTVATLHIDGLIAAPQAVPEPGVLGLIALGLAGLGLRRRNSALAEI